MDITFGRIDQQIKMRGFRIELGEIESVLCHHEKVKEAIVIAGNDEGLIAYFTIKQEIGLVILHLIMGGVLYYLSLKFLMYQAHMILC